MLPLAGKGNSISSFCACPQPRRRLQIQLPNSHSFISACPCDFPAPRPEHNPQTPGARLVCAILVTADPIHHLGATGGTAAGYKVEAGSSTPGCRGMGWSKAMAAPGTVLWDFAPEEMPFCVSVSLVGFCCKLSRKLLSC